jgi:transcription-repair coupling factor (superfamily II helicase)
LLNKDQPAVVVAPVQALMQSVPEEDAMGSMSLQIEAGMPLEQDDLSKWLVDAGYARVDVVEEPGDFALRGGLVGV